MSKELSADPKKNRNWREVYQQRVEALESRVKGWEELYSRSELSGVEEKVLLLRKEALVLGKMITKYHNYIADDTIKWRKRNGFMAGKSVFLDDDAIFWIFKSPGETMAFGGARYPNYISKDRQNKVVRTTEDRLHNISYSRGFLEVYSLAEIMMPEYIMPFAVAQKLKYPDQFFVATRFVDDAQPLREETLRSNADIVDRFKSVRLIGSIIGFDDMIYPNILVDQRQKLVAIDGINPISDNNKRRNFFSLIKRNFFEFQGMFGGCAMGEENVSQRKFEDFKEEIPQLALTLGDLRILERLVEDKRDILREFFGKVEPFVDRESLPIKKYFKDNVNQLKCLTSSLSSQELDYLVTDVDLQHAREIYAKSLRDPSASALQNNQKGIQIDS